MTFNYATPDVREQKLPTWVRDTLRELRAGLAVTQQELREAREQAEAATVGTNPEAATITYAGPDGTEMGLPAKTQEIEFKRIIRNTDAEGWIRVSLRDTDESLVIEGSRNLTVRPWDRDMIWLRLDPADLSGYVSTPPTYHEEDHPNGDDSAGDHPHPAARRERRLVG